MKFFINGVPNVCAELHDQSLCQRAIELCGANTSPDVCTAKLVGLSVVNSEQYVDFAKWSMEMLLRFSIKSSYYLIEVISHFMQFPLPAG